MKPLKLAPTTLTLWQECPRKGAFRTIGKVRTPPSPGLYEGNAGHKHVEAYCRDGVTPDRADDAARAAWMRYVPPGTQEYTAACNVWGMSDAAQAAYKKWVHAYMGRVVGDVLGALPAPGPNVEVEQNVLLNTGNAWRFHGRFDVLVDQKRVIDPKFYAQSSMKNFALDAERLRRNPQAIIYSAWCDDPNPEFTMLYIVKPSRSGKGTAKAKPVTVQFTADEIDARLDELDALAEKILWYVTHVEDPNDVPHTADLACGGVGLGCDFVEHCKAVP